MDYEIRFGAVAPPLRTQINEQFDLSLSEEDVLTEQRLADSVSLLGVHSVLTDSEVKRARSRIVKRLLKIVGNYKVQSVTADEVKETDEEETDQADSQADSD